MRPAAAGQIIYARGGLPVLPMTSPELIILGASARAAAAAAKRAGFRPIAIDLFADADLQAIAEVRRIERYPGQFLRALRETPEAPWMYVGGLENYPRLVDRLAKIRPLLGNVGLGLRRVRDPRALHAFLVSRGFKHPGTEADPAARHVVKPFSSAGGRGIRMVDGRANFTLSRGWYRQPYIEGVAASALIVASGQQASLLGLTRQLLGREFGLSEPFAYAGSIGPLVVTDQVHTELGRLGQALAEGYGLRGVFGIDFVLQDKTLWVMEVNPRLTASAEIVERMTGLNAVALHARACQQEFAGKDIVPVSNDVHRCFGKAVVYAQHPSQAGSSFASLLQRRRGDPWPEIADLPAQGTKFRPGDPVVTVFAEGVNDVEVTNNLRERSAEVLAALDPADAAN